MSHQINRPFQSSCDREIGKPGSQQRNKDKLGCNSGPMGAEDCRKNKFGSLHNQDAQGLSSPETQSVRKVLSCHRQKHHRRRRLGSR